MSSLLAGIPGIGRLFTEAKVVETAIKTDLEKGPGMIGSILSTVTSPRAAAMLIGKVTAVYLGAMLAVKELPKLRDAVTARSHREIAFSMAKILGGTACSVVGLLAMCKTVPHNSKA